MIGQSLLATFCFAVCISFIPLHASAHEINPEVIYKLTGETITHDHATDTEESLADPRNESRTFYSFPEWYIVYSAQEYGRFVTSGHRPSQFPYFASIGQMWDAWDSAAALATDAPDSTTNTVLWTISLSYTIESGVIGVYEATLGRVSEWLHFGHKTVEDEYLDAQAVAYGEFLNQVPWYEFPYLASLKGLWQTWGWSSLSPRGIERRIIYTIGYSIKAAYAAAIRTASAATYEGGASQTTTATVLANANQLTELGLPYEQTTDTESYRVTFPRYRAFTTPAVSFATAGGQFITIEGHNVIALSVIADTTTDCEGLQHAAGYAQTMLTEPALARYVVRTPTAELANTITAIQDCNYTVEHIYDY